MAATEASTEPVQADTVETKAEEEPANVESAPAPAEETQPTTEAPQSTEQAADNKVKPASEKIWDSFLNKSGLGKVMGGKKKKDHGTVAEDAAVEEPDKATAANASEQGDAAELKEQATSQSAETSEVATDNQAIEKVPENEEVVQEQKAAGTKPKQGEKSSVRDFIRKPVARIFSHRSTEKKEGTGEVPKHGKVRSKSLDRLEDAEASTVVVDQVEDPQAPEEPDKSTSQSTKHMKRWHSFKKLMAQKGHKKSADDKDVEGAEGVSAEAPGDTGTLDSTTKSEHTGQKRWKLKRSWTFQGLKRDTSMVGIHKPKDKDSSDNLKDENAPEGEQGTTRVSEGEGESEEKTNAEGEEEKGATAATSRAKFVDQHANEIWTSFKKRVIPKSKKTSDTSGGEEEPAGEQEQTDEQQAGKDSGKTAKSKRTHFNRAVSLKNFILRKGKSASMDMGEGSAAQKEGEGEAKETDGPADTAGSADVPQGGSEDQAATQSESNNSAQVADEHKSSDGEEKSLPSIPSGQQADKPHLASEGESKTEPAVEPKTNGENGCSDAALEDTTAHNHELPTPNDEGKGEETTQENINSSENKSCPKDGKILNQDGKCGTGNAVAQSGEFEAEIDSSDLQQKAIGKSESIVALGCSVEVETELCRGPQNGGSFSESPKTSDVPDDPDEALKRMLYEAATSIVRTVVSAATAQLAKEKDLLDSRVKCSQATNSGSYTDVDVGYCH